MSSIHELAAQIQMVVSMDNTAKLHDGSVKEVQVTVTELCCPECGHLEMNPNAMMFHLLMCSGGGQTAIRNYQKFKLAPAGVMKLYKEVQTSQEKILLVPVKGLPESHIRLPVISPLAHLVLGGAKFTTNSCARYSYELRLKSQTIHIDLFKFIHNSLFVKDAPSDY